jgi:hypothetical protein
VVVQYYMDWLYNLHEHLGSPPDFGGVRVAHLFRFLWCVAVFHLSSSCSLFAQCCQCLWIVHSWLSLRFYLTYYFSLIACCIITNNYAYVYLRVFYYCIWFLFSNTRSCSVFFWEVQKSLGHWMYLGSWMLWVHGCLYMDTYY